MWGVLSVHSADTPRWYTGLDCEIITRALRTTCTSGRHELRRYIESALRLKVRLIVCAILVFGLSFGALYFSKGGYSSAATVWVEKPLFIDVGNLNFSQYISPAKNQ